MSSIRDRLEKIAAAKDDKGDLALYVSKKLSEKRASVAEYSVLFDKVASGDLGEHTRQALLGICDTIPEPTTLSEKTASVYDVMDFSENDARRARLDQLLKR